MQRYLLAYHDDVMRQAKVNVAKREMARTRLTVTVHQSTWERFLADQPPGWRFRRAVTTLDSARTRQLVQASLPLEIFNGGVAQGLGVDAADVSSPTFTLIQEYRGGRLPLLHVDLYRLDDAREIEELGLDELGSEGVVAIEWAEKLPRRIGDTIIVVRIVIGDDDTRVIQVVPNPTP